MGKPKRNSPERMLLKESNLSVAIVRKLKALKVSNPDAPAFKPQPESVTLVRHLIWLAKRAGKQNLEKNDGDYTALLNLLGSKFNSDEVQEIVTFLNESFPWFSVYTIGMGRSAFPRFTFSK